jgi:hypothetical protein
VPRRVTVDTSDFEPTPSQQAFLDAQERVVALLGGYGSGKSRGLAEKVLDLAAANPGCDGLIVAPTWGILHKVTLRAFYDPSDPDAGACPRELVAEYHAGKRYIRLVNDCRIYFGSADRPGTLEGANLAFFGLDEARLARQVAWKILLGRLRDQRAKRLQAAVVSTPLAGWLQEEFGSQKTDRRVIHASTRENAHHLAPGFIEDLERTYSAREARVLIDGEFGLLVGAVYEEFERKTHLLDWTYDPRLRTVEFWDFGYRRPYVGWAQYVPAGWALPGGGRMHSAGAWVIFDELTDENLSTELLAGKAKTKGYSVERIWCDPAGDGMQSATGMTDVLAVRAHRCVGTRPEIRFTTDPKWRHIPNGIGIVRGLLRNARQEIRLYVARSLDKPKATRGVVKDLEGYAYPEAKDGKPVGDLPVKDGLHDHGCDGIRYFAVGEHIAANGAQAGTIASL